MAIRSNHSPIASTKRKLIISRGIVVVFLPTAVCLNLIVIFYRKVHYTISLQAESKRGHLQLVSFPKSRLTDALAHIKQHAQITRNGINDRPEVFATGFGCVELGKTINETLEIQYVYLEICVMI